MRVLFLFMVVLLAGCGATRTAQPSFADEYDVWGAQGHHPGVMYSPVQDDEPGNGAPGSGSTPGNGGAPGNGSTPGGFHEEWGGVVDSFTTEEFDLDAGALTAEVQYGGDPSFLAWLVEVGTGDEILVISTDTAGSTTIGVDAGTYKLSIIAHGPWNIVLTQ